MTLEELDLRNNKIGPQGVQLLAAALKHNTSLRRLGNFSLCQSIIDLRWNSAGLTGARAFVDSLKSNFTLTEIDLTGNEVPEDLNLALGIIIKFKFKVSALERNKDKFKHEIATSAHSEQLTTTLHTLTSSHQEAIQDLSKKLTHSDSNAVSLSAKLALASIEIEESQAAFRDLEAKYDRMSRERTELEDLLNRGQKESGIRITDLQKELAREREVG